VSSGGSNTSPAVARGAASSTAHRTVLASEIVILGTLVTVSLVDAAWSPAAASAAVVFLAIHVILLVRAPRRSTGRRSAAGTAADWAGVLVAVVGAAISLAQLVLDHRLHDAAPEPQFEIIVPAAGSPVGQCVLVRGLGVPKAGYRLWTVVQSDGSGHYHPRRPVVYDRISEPTSWSVATEVGLTNQPNSGYDIVTVLIPDDVSRIWTEALKAGNLPGYSELPKGSREVDRVSVSLSRDTSRPCTKAGG